jgi:hypothetical protein
VIPSRSSCEYSRPSLYRDRIGVAGDVGRQPDLDAQLLAGLLRAVAVAGEQLVGIEPQ